MRRCDDKTDRYVVQKTIPDLGSRTVHERLTYTLFSFYNSNGWNITYCNYFFRQNFSPLLQSHYIVSPIFREQSESEQVHLV